MSARDAGRTGEETAVKYLEKSGWQILGRNVTRPGGEIDIIAQKDDIIAFVEVKARSGQRYGSGAEAVTPTKMRRVARAAVQIAQENGWMERRMRFDVVEITPTEVRHIESAFPMPENLW